MGGAHVTLTIAADCPMFPLAHDEPFPPRSLDPFALHPTLTRQATLDLTDDR
jgi:hypothetical protein